MSRRWRIFLIAAAAAVVVGTSLLYLFLDAVVKRAVSSIPIAWENRLGESLFAAMTAGRPRAPEKDAAVVKAAFERLRAHATSPGYEFEYAVLESPEVNAFALPGGKFVVFTGLLAKAGRPEEVAGVLAHEFQHAVLRHSLQKMVRAAGLRAVLALLIGDLDGLGGVVRDAGVQIQELSYGRDQEREADFTAVDLLAAAGIDPTGLPDFFDRLAAQAGAAGGRGAGARAALHPPGERGAQRGPARDHRQTRLRTVRAALGPMTRAAGAAGTQSGEAGRDMDFTSSIADLVRRRRSCRKYLEQPLAENARSSLEAFLAANRLGPLGSRARFELVAATVQDRTALKGLGTYGFISGATGFIVGAIEQAPGPLRITAI